MAVDPRTPCVIGVAQRTWQPVNPDPVDAPEPLDMWEEVARAAAEDSGIPGVETDVDSLQIVYCQTWPYDDPVGRLCERTGAQPRHRYYSGIGGTTPQVLVNHTAASILRGEYDLAPMTEIAAENPYAWFPLERSATELITATAENRLVGYPYTKYMVSVMDVDMAAALLVASHEKADALGVPADRRVYLRGWAYGNDPWYVAERPELWRSEAMKQVSQAALAM